MRRLIDLTGERFGRWVVIKKALNKNGLVYWFCKCDCGNERNVRASILKKGESKSCGCYQKEVVYKMCTENNPSKKTEAREKIRESKLGCKNPRFGVKDIELSNRMKKIKGENHPLFDTNVPEERKERISKSLLGKHCSPQTEFKRGENHPHWLGGISAYPYPPEFNKKLKNYIREKFNHTCILCGEWANIPHHIDYNKTNNVEENFALLCIIDNNKANFNRDQWEIGFKTFIEGSQQKSLEAIF